MASTCTEAMTVPRLNKLEQHREYNPRACLTNLGG
jgi:hypothetical protein